MAEHADRRPPAAGGTEQIGSGTQTVQSPRPPAQATQIAADTHGPPERQPPLRWQLVAVVPRQYDVDGREAHLYQCGDENFLRVELYDGFFSLGWSCSLPIATVLERVEPVLAGLGGRRGVIFDERAQEHRELGVREAVNQLRTVGGAWSFARLELPTVTLIWEQAAAEPEGAEEPLSELPTGGEFGLMASVFDAEVCARIVRETATTAISEHADDLIDDVAYVAQHLGSGHLVLPNDIGDAGLAGPEHAREPTHRAGPTC